MQLLAARLQRESRDVYASHVAYLCSGKLPTSSSSSSSNLPSLGGSTNSTPPGYTLIGADTSQPRTASIDDCLTVHALRLTEVLEWALLRGLAISNNNRHTKNAPKKKNGSSGGLLGGLLGIGSGSKSDKKGKDVGAETDASGGANATKNTYVMPIELLAMQKALCPLKLRYAAYIADLGYVQEALQYALEAKHLAMLCNTLCAGAAAAGPQARTDAQAQAPPHMKPPKGHAPSPHIQGGPASLAARLGSFSPQFLMEVDLFLDRCAGGQPISIESVGMGSHGAGAGVGVGAEGQAAAGQAAAGQGIRPENSNGSEGSFV
jgi:hypothetical protein